MKCEMRFEYGYTEKIGAEKKEIVHGEIGEGEWEEKAIRIGIANYCQGNSKRLYWIRPKKERVKNEMFKHSEDEKCNICPEPTDLLACPFCGDKMKKTRSIVTNRDIFDAVQHIERNNNCPVGVSIYRIKMWQQRAS